MRGGNVFHSQVLTSRLGQLRARWRLGELESRVTGCLRQQKSHVSLQETGQIFKADTARWTEWLNAELWAASEAIVDRDPGALVPLLTWHTAYL